MNRFGHEKQRHAYRPIEFFGSAVDLHPGELFVPERGFRRDVYQPPRSEFSPNSDSIPVYTIAVERARTFELFMQLLGTLEGDLGVILESQHDAVCPGKPQNFYFSVPDRVVLESALPDYQDLLVGDGYTGICVMSEDQQCEVMFTDHKVLHYYGTEDVLTQVQTILRKNDILFRPRLRVISDPGIAHVHQTTSAYCDQFHDLMMSMREISFL